jgi:hypothetical protein
MRSRDESRFLPPDSYGDSYGDSYPADKLSGYGDEGDEWTPPTLEEAADIVEAFGELAPLPELRPIQTHVQKIDRAVWERRTA